MSIYIYIYILLHSYTATSVRVSLCVCARVQNLDIHIYIYICIYIYNVYILLWSTHVFDDAISDQAYTGRCRQHAQSSRLHETDARKVL